MSDGRSWRGRAAHSALWQLTTARNRTFLREPEALFWVFAFPVLMALALGIAFRSQGPQTVRVGVEAGPHATELADALAASRDLEVVTVTPEAGELGLRRGRIAVLVRVGEEGAPVLLYDPARPETRLAHLAAVDALERAAGRVDRVHTRSDTRPQAGSRYIDFLIPGLVGLNLLGTSMWGIGFWIVYSRQQKLLKRMIATPMRRSDYLLASILGRMVWLGPEVAIIVVFGHLAFGVGITGSWAAYAVVCLAGALALSALSLLVASRVRTIEGVSGLMNVIMMPMWLMSGVFFSPERFPDAMQPFIQALPLTAVNDALRMITNEGVGFAAVAGELGILAAWGIVSFAAALRLFRWE